jgi:hypothetical protein
MGCAPFLFGRKSSEYFLPNSLMVTPQNNLLHNEIQCLCEID